MRKILLTLFLGGALVSCEKPTKEAIAPENLAPPTILHLLSTADTVGAVVKLLGTNFSKTPANNIISFGAQPAPAFACQQDTLYVRVPPGATTGPLTLRVYEQSTTSKEPFTILTGRWRRRANISLPRWKTVTTTVGAKVYFGTGEFSPTQFLATPRMAQDLWAYDPAANTWTRQADFPGGSSCEMLGFTLGSLAYMGFGYDQSYKETRGFYAYDPASNRWTLKASPPFNTPVLREFYAVAFVVQEKGYVVMVGEERQVWEYDPQANTWTRKKDFPGARRHSAAGFSLGSHGFVAGGKANLDDKVEDSFWQYTPSTDTWSSKAPVPTFGSAPIAFVLAGTAYFGLNSHREIYTYNEALNSWQLKTRFPGIAEITANAETLNGKAYVLGGFSSKGMSGEVWEFTP